MSSLANITRRAFGIAEEGRGDRSGAMRKLGSNKRDAYYGNVANEILGQKHGDKKYVQALEAQGAELTAKAKSKRVNSRMPSAAGQLLGGGG